MRYGKVVEAKFLNRPNRFIAEVAAEEGTCTAHVKNTGRCRELLIPGCTVYLSVLDHPGRKTKYDLICVEKTRDAKSPLLVNVDSQIPNAAAGEWLRKSGMFSAGAVIRREVKYRNSRFDFFIEDGPRKIFLEVKGVTLEKNGTAMFPDAPTERGVKHVHELTECVADGFEAYVMFVIQMGEVCGFLPNDATHPAFGDALRTAAERGVKLLALNCRVTPDSIEINVPVQVDLAKQTDHKDGSCV